MATTRHALAHWSGDLKTGGGTISTPQSGLMAETAYGFNTRFGDKKGTNPEELIAAAHASCFTMALSNALAQAGHAPDAVDTRAEVDLTMDGGPTINAIRLETKARVPGMDAAQFRAIADDAKQNCPVSKALSAVPITLKAELLG
jgi:osmotically inducible protein OsmC